MRGRRFLREVKEAGLAATGEPGAEVREEELARLPEPARRLLRRAGVVGRPRDTTFRARLALEFRLKPGAAWLPAEAWQFNSGPDLARIFHMELRLGRVLPVYGRDLYLRGRGRMLIRPLDLFTLQDARGPELDVGELVTWLNDAVLLAPAMLLDERVVFSPVDGDRFGLRVTDGASETSATAVVTVDAAGDVSTFTTEDRWLEGKRRARWSTPVSGWREEGGRRVPGEGRAIWHLPEGDYTYARLHFVPGALAFGVAPGT